MALIQVSNELMKDAEMFNLILESFDTFEEIERCDSAWVPYRTLRVQHEEVPKEDVLIDPCFYAGFEGVRPFVIQWSS